MNKEIIILNLMHACGDDCRNKILEGKYDDVSGVMNYLEVLTLANSWEQASDIVKKIWYKHNPLLNIE